MTSVDVIIPCYRYGHFLRHCVESVLAQTGPAIRVLIIDDASPDNTSSIAAELANKDERVSVVRHLKNAGHINTYNEGLKWASSEYLLLLSADDYLLPGALGRAARLMDVHPEVGFVFGNFVELKENGNARQVEAVSGMRGEKPWLVYSGVEFILLSGDRNIVPTPTAVVRTELQNRLGGYRRELPHTGDMEMWLRLAAHAAVGFINEYQAVYRRHAECMSGAYAGRNSLRDVQQRKAAFDCFFQSDGRGLPNWKKLQRKLLRRLASDAAQLSSAAFNRGEMRESKELSRVAVRIGATVWASQSGVKLVCKRAMGRSTWLALSEVISSVRSWPSTALLRMQRLNLPVPGPIRKRMLSLMERVRREQMTRTAVDDWSLPLISRPYASTAPGRGSQRDCIAPVQTSGCEVAGSLHEPHGRAESATLSTNSGAAFEPARCLKVLLTTSSMDVGGMEEVVVFLASRLPRYGFRTAVLHASSAGTPDGVPTGRLGRQLRAAGIETVEFAADDGARWLRSWRPDVISAHDPPPWVLEAATNLKVPYVETLHGMHSLFEADSIALANRGRRIAMIVSVSDLVRQQYLELNPTFPAERIVTIPNGVDDVRRVHCDREMARTRFGIRDEYIFVSLARYCLQKNTYGLIAAFAEVASRHPEAHLLLAGRPDDPAYFAQLVSLRQSLTCCNRIHLRDHSSQPAELLALADGFVLDSFFEGWSLASMEALHAGVPVVLSEVGGAREQVGGKDTRGCLIPNPIGDPFKVNWQTMREARFARQSNREPLVAAMSSLIGNRTSYEAARSVLAAESAQRFHPDVCLHAHSNVLESAAKLCVAN